MKNCNLAILSNEMIAKDTHKLCLTASGAADGILPGQFINIKLEGLYLRRPISVFDAERDTVTVVYKVVGKGTEQLCLEKPGKVLDVLTQLGNGFDLSTAGQRPLLASGGVGTAPMYMLARKLIASGAKPVLAAGFNTKDDVFAADDFRALGCDVIIATADGSSGVKGFTTDAMKDLDYSYLYCCGPEVMLRAVYKMCKISGQFSFEERMGCGFGACMGCSCKTVTGYKRICKDGPVLLKEEILWED